MLSDIEVLLAVTGALERLRIDYVVGGSIASSALGFYRSTNDADILADLTPDRIDPFAGALESIFYLDRERMRSAIVRKSQFNLIHLKKALKVDIYIPSGDAFSRQQLTRRFRTPVAPHVEARIYLPSPEDVVLQKLRWFRMGGETSERQWLDVLGVLKVQKPTIDRDYLRQWADEIGVADLLVRAFSDAGY